MRKREYGSGNIERRGGWWVVRFRERVTVNGEPAIRRRTEKLVLVDEQHKTKRSIADDNSVQQMIAAILQPVQARKDTPQTVVTVGEFIQRVYMPMVQERKRPSTYKGYRDIYEDHLKSRCQDDWLRDVRTHRVQQLLYQITDEDGLSKTTIKHVKHFLSGVFKYAAQMDYFDRGNPVTACSLPEDAPAAAETYAYSLDEIGGMLEVLPEPAATIVAVAAFAGLRRGEIRGLRWEDYEPSVNGSVPLLHINRSIWTGAGYDRANGGVTLPKTAKSKAPVPVIATLAGYIDSYREQCGNPAVGPMFPNGKGKPHDLDGIYRYILKDIFALKRIAWHGWHSFRRGLATNLHSLGVDDKTIQAILRHSNIATTQNVYIKSVPDDVVAGMRRLEAAFGARRKQAAAVA